MRNNAAARADLETLPFGAHHFGNIGAVNIHVADTDLVSLQRQADGQVRGDGAFADPALVAHDEDLVVDPLHAFGHQPPAVTFLVFLTRFILVTNRARPHVRTSIPLRRSRLKHLQFSIHECLQVLLR